jgi:hypothetical protein
MKSFFSKLFGAKTGVSSKRFIGFLAAITMIFVAVVDLFTDKTVSNYVFEGLMWLAIAGLGFVASERFADVLVSRKKENIRDASADNQPIEQFEDEQSTDYPRDGRFRH